MKYLYAFTLVVNLLLVAACTVLILAIWDARDASIEMMQAMDRTEAALNNMTATFNDFDDTMVSSIAALEDFRQKLISNYTEYFQLHNGD